MGSLRDREVACSASDRQGSNFESCVWSTVSSHSSHHPQEVLLAQFSLYVHKGGLKPDSFHFNFLWTVETRASYKVLYIKRNLLFRFGEKHLSTLPAKPTLTQCWSTAGSQSATLAQHQTSTGSTPRVRWALWSVLESFENLRNYK